MKSLIFEQPNVNLKLKNDTYHQHIFKGVNITPYTFKIETMGTSCGCLSFVKPQEIKPNQNFEIITNLNKIGQTGYFSIRLTFKISNGEEYNLVFAGEMQNP